MYSYYTLQTQLFLRHRRVLHTDPEYDLYQGHDQHQSLFVSLYSSWYNKNCKLNNTILIRSIYTVLILLVHICWSSVQAAGCSPDTTPA